MNDETSGPEETPAFRPPEADDFEMVAVDSSNVAEIGYDAASSTLRVVFHAGTSYRYAEVRPGLYRRFLASPSKGAFFARLVRPTYAYQKEGEPTWHVPAGWKPPAYRLPEIDDPEGRRLRAAVVEAARLDRGYGDAVALREAVAALEAHEAERDARAVEP